MQINNIKTLNILGGKSERYLSADYDGELVIAVPSGMRGMSIQVDPSADTTVYATNQHEDHIEDGTVQWLPWEKGAVSTPAAEGVNVGTSFLKVEGQGSLTCRAVCWV